jgi:hypothetical protein
LGRRRESKLDPSQSLNFGSADRLRAEIRTQRIDFNRLAPELQGVQAVLRA